MKMTDSLKHGFNLLKKHGTVTILAGYNGTPHVFTSANNPAKLDSRGRLDNRIKTINRQTLNKLILLGYAEYTDKTKNSAVFIDKDAKQSELERLAEIGRATEKAFKEHHARLRLFVLWPSGTLKDAGSIVSIEDLLEWATHEWKAGEGKERNENM